MNHKVYRIDISIDQTWFIQAGCNYVMQALQITKNGVPLRLQRVPWEPLIMVMAGSSMLTFKIENDTPQLTEGEIPEEISEEEIKKLIIQYYTPFDRYKRKRK